MTQTALSLEGVSKSYQRGKVHQRDLKASLSSWWKNSKRQKEFFNALEDINLRIEQGDIVGIVGPNGAGKSTLLKLLSRITFPTTGKIIIHGTLSSMLEIGTGFHPELTGRENIFLNGAIIGMRRSEVSRKLDSIVAFSGIEPFIDTPVKHYSSGMYVRLAFAVASHLEPDILLLDEILAMGDHDYKRKCMDKLLDVSGQGRTIIMVSHQMSYLKELCQTGLYLNEGKILFRGSIDDTISHYINHYSETKEISVHEKSNRKGTGHVRMQSIRMLDKNRDQIYILTSGQLVIFRLDLKVFVSEVFNVMVQLEFYDMYGHIAFVTNNSISGTSIPKLHGTYALECVIPKIPLNTNLYFVNVVIYHSKQLSDEALSVLSFEVASGNFYESGHLPPSGKGFLVDYNWTEGK